MFAWFHHISENGSTLRETHVYKQITHKYSEKPINLQTEWTHATWTRTREIAFSLTIPRRLTEHTIALGQCACAWACTCEPTLSSSWQSPHQCGRAGLGAGGSSLHQRCAEGCTWCLNSWEPHTSKKLDHRGINSSGIWHHRWPIAHKGGQKVLHDDSIARNSSVESSSCNVSHALGFFLMG